MRFISRKSILPIVMMLFVNGLCFFVMLPVLYYFIQKFLFHNSIGFSIDLAVRILSVLLIYHKCEAVVTSFHFYFHKELLHLSISLLQ